jgi:dTDP-glucose 4,6-dehydratase
VDDHSSAILCILDNGIIGQTYLIAANDQKNNLQVIEIILKVMNKPKNWLTFIKDRQGHDLRYAIDSRQAMKALK